MARLPQPGADDGTWGDILNGYLQVSLDGNGLINPGTVTESQLASAVQTKLNNVGTVADGSITTAKVADGAIAQAKLSGSVQSQLSNIGTVNDGAVTTAKLADGAVTNATLADGTISETKLDTATQAKLDATAPVTSVNTKTGAVILDKIDIGLGNIDNTSDANKPVSSATQTALNAKATTASLATVATSGSYSDLAGKPTVPAQFNPLAGTNVSLSGTYPNITFSATPGAGVTDLSTTQTATDVTVQSSTGADATIPSADTTNAGVLSAADKTKLNGIATGATANSSDATLLNRANHTGVQAISTVTGLQTTLDAKATTASLATVATSGSYTDLTNQPTIPTVSDATTSTKGIIQLAGDLAGTAAAPTVPGLAGKEPTIAAGTTAQYWRGDKSWQALDKTAVGLANVDNTSDLNKPISTATQTALNNKADSSAIVGSNVFVYNAYADAPALPVNTVVISKTGS